MTSDKKLLSKIRRIIGYSIPLLFTIAFLYLAVYNVDFAEVIDKASQLSIFWLILFLAAFLFSHLLRAIRWKVILNSFNPDTSLLNLFGATMVGYGVNCVVPRLGEFYRSFFGGKWENISRSSMLGTVVIERVIDLLILGISVLFSILIYKGNLFLEIQWLKSTIVIGFTIIGLLILLLYLLIKLKEKFVTVSVKLFSRISVKFAEKIAYVLHTLIDGFSSLKGFKNYALTVFYSVLIMLVYGLTSYLAFFMIGMNEVQHVDYAMAWVVMTIGAFGIIIPTPGGTGSYHFIMKAVLVGLYGFSEEMGLAYAFVTHTVTYIVFILSTVIMIYVINFKRVKAGFPRENFLSVIKAGRSVQ